MTTEPKVTQDVIDDLLRMMGEVAWLDTTPKGISKLLTKAADLIKELQRSRTQAPEHGEAVLIYTETEHTTIGGAKRHWWKAVDGYSPKVGDKLFTSPPQSQSVREAGCICYGNWRLIMSEIRELIGRKYLDHKGEEYRFFGLVDGADDYYYGMSKTSDHSVQLLSCVGNIEGFGWTLVEDALIEQSPPAEGGNEHEN